MKASRTAPVPVRYPRAMRLVVGVAASFASCLLACSSDDAASSPVRDAGGATISDGGAGDPGDAAGADPGHDASVHGGCDGKTYKLCDDFDTAAAGSTPTGWTILKGYGNTPPPTAVATDEFHSAPSSIKTSSDVSGASRILRALSGIGATAGTHWGRVFFKVRSPAPQLTKQGPHATFVALEGNLRAGELRVVDTQQATSGKIQLLANTPDDQCCTGTDFSYTIWDGAWHCSEWYVDHVTQSYRYFLDGAEVTKLAFNYGAGSTKANMPAAFTGVALGSIFYTPMLPSPLVTWFDDLAIDDAQIGCQ